MSTIRAILEPDVDGTLHLPLPEELRHGMVKVEARLEAVEAAQEGEKSGARASLTASPEMIERRKAALAEVRKLNPYRDIPDPVAWQKATRQDRTLPGRD